MGTPLVDGSVLYGMTEEGGSNGYIGGVLFTIDTDGNGFNVLHHFGGQIDGVTDGENPHGTLVLSGSTLYGLTTAGGADLEGAIFSMNTDGSHYKLLYSFGDVPGETAPEGSLILSGSVLYGMTQGSLFQINTDGTGFQTLHSFSGATTDGGTAYGSPLLVGSVLYGMTATGGTNNEGSVFYYDTSSGHFNLLHSFALTEGFTPFGDLVLDNSMLYGMTWQGVTNYHGIPAGNGTVFRINTDGSSYQILHTFLFPETKTDGSLPYGTPVILGSTLYGMTSLGGSFGLPLDTHDGGTIFSLAIPAGSSGGGGGNAPTITTSSPLPNGKLGEAYDAAFSASGGTAPYTWSAASGSLPSGLHLSTAGVLNGKPTKGGVFNSSIKVTDHKKQAASQLFTLTIAAPPSLTILTPRAGMKVTTATLTVAGTVTGTAAITGVYVQLNANPWTAAQLAGVSDAWVAELPLAVPADTVRAYAVDANGNYSKTNSVKFTYKAPTPGPAMEEESLFGTLTGNYRGLYLADLNRSGLIQLSVTPSGVFSGKIMLGTRTLTFTGSFDNSGNAEVAGKGETSLKASLRWNAAEQTITGAMRTAGFTGNILACRN